MATESVNIALDVDELSLGELEAVEEYTGKTIFEIESDLSAGTVRARTLTALVWLAKHREDDTYTFDDAKSVRASAIRAKGGDTDPTQAADVPSGGG